MKLPAPRALKLIIDAGCILLPSEIGGNKYTVTGTTEGALVGIDEGVYVVGDSDGVKVGITDGWVGFTLGTKVGADGIIDGAHEGVIDGETVTGV